MNIALWILQVLMGAFFIVTGGGKVFCFKDALWLRAQHMIPWIDGVSRGVFLLCGIAEFLGGLGLILPALTRIKPRLTPWAAVGLGGVMIMATGFHVGRREFAFMALTLALTAVFIFLAYGRFVLRPIHARPATARAISIGLGALVAGLALLFLTLPPETWKN